MKVRQIRPVRQEVCEDTRKALDAADAALAKAWTAMEKAGDAMLRNGDGDLRALQDAVKVMLQARSMMNA